MPELPPDIERLLELARRADEPRDEDRARVSRTLALALGLPETGWTGASDVSASTAAQTTAATTQAVGTAGTTGLVLKTSALVVALVTAGGGVLYVAHDDTAESNARRPPAVAPQQRDHDTTSSSPASPREDLLRRTASAREVDEAARTRSERKSLGSPSATVAAPARAPQAADLSAGRSERSTQTIITGHAKLRAGSAALRPMTGQQPEAAAELAPDPSAEPNMLGETASNGALHEELAALEVASRALERGDAGAALRAVEAHRRDFGTGFLAEEREALRIIALCGLGRVSEATQARLAFERRAPHSPLRKRMDEECKRPDPRRQ